MKKGVWAIFALLIFSISLMLISSVSAYTYGYGGGLGDFLNRVDSSTVVLTTLFIICFAFINFALTRYFGRENKTTAGVVAAAISMLIIYGINASGFSFDNFFYSFGYSIGLPIDFIYSILPFIVIIGFIFIGMKNGWGAAFLILGAVLIASSFFVFEKGLLMTLGVIAIIIGTFLSMEKKSESGFKIKIGP